LKEENGSVVSAGRSGKLNLKWSQARRKAMEANSENKKGEGGIAGKEELNGNND